MTRSHRKTPIRGISSSESEKADKVSAHKRLRRKVAQVLRSSSDGEILPHEKETSDPWQMAKDGKQRFDPLVFKHLLRK